MKNLPKTLAKKMFQKFPVTTLPVEFWSRTLRYQNERKAYKGRDLAPGNGKSSVVFFTHYRCASMMLMNRLWDLLEVHRFKRIDYQGLVHFWTLDERAAFQGDSSGHDEFSRFNPLGRVYGPLRYFVDIPRLESFKVVLVLRDPRDVLVSRYYSEKFAHVRLDKRFRSHCEEIEALTVDDFVLKFASDVQENYGLFAKNKDKWKHGLFTKYEDLISDFPKFIKEVNDYCELGHSADFVASVAAKESFVVNAEDKFSHKRSVQARGFEKKLKPETITELNRMLRSELLFFGWETAESLGS